MMEFRIVKNAIKTLLEGNAAGNYQVVGFQKQEKSAEEFSGTNRLVETYFKAENFDKNKSRFSGPVNGAVTIAIELTVSAPSKADLSVIDNPGSTPAQIQTAISDMKSAALVADDSFDELADIIYQVLMDPRNEDLGLSKGEVSNRWVSTLSKNDPNPRGQLVVLTGFLEYSCSVSENFIGDLSGRPIVTNDTVLDIGENDTVQKTGIKINY